MIAVSTGERDVVWDMSGKWDREYVNGEYEFDEYYDRKKDMRSPFYTLPEDDRIEHFEADRFDALRIKYIFPAQDPVKELGNGGSFFYIYMPSQNGGREKIIRDSYTITEEGEYTYRSWTVAYMSGFDGHR